jgi:hypothetical protein
VIFSWWNFFRDGRAPMRPPGLGGLLVQRAAAPPVPPIAMVGRVVNVACLAPEQPFLGETQLEGADESRPAHVLLREQKRRQGRTQPPTSKKTYVCLCACPGTCRVWAQAAERECLTRRRHPGRGRRSVADHGRLRTLAWTGKRRPTRPTPSVRSARVHRRRVCGLCINVHRHTGTHSDAPILG